MAWGGVGGRIDPHEPSAMFKLIITLISATTLLCGCDFAPGRGDDLRRSVPAGSHSVDELCLHDGFTPCRKAPPTSLATG